MFDSQPFPLSHTILARQQSTLVKKLFFFCTGWGCGAETDSNGRTTHGGFLGELGGFGPRNIWEKPISDE
jgi:hypothetical protein